MPDQTTSRNAIVIGVGPEDGLGGQLCVRFAERGHHVFIAGRTAEKVEALAATIGANATPIVTDATDEAQVTALFDTAYEFLYHQPRNAWSFEVDVRTSLERW